MKSFLSAFGDNTRTSEEDNQYNFYNVLQPIFWHSVPAKRCFLLFTLQKACYTRSVCLSPAKRLFIVVNVVFVVFHPQQAHRERARWQGPFRSCGEVPLVGAVGGWPVGSPGASPSPCAQGGGRVSGFQRGREACRPAPWVNRPGCRRPGLRRYPDLRRPWWPS